jgi:hypothetical protein
VCPLPLSFSFSVTAFYPSISEDCLLITCTDFGPSLQITLLQLKRTWVTQLSLFIEVRDQQTLLTNWAKTGWIYEHCYKTNTAIPLDKNWLNLWTLL